MTTTTNESLDRRRIFTRWIEALTSGAYEQGSGYLTTKNSDGDEHHCCLGVLVDCAGDDLGVEKRLPVIDDAGDVEDGFALPRRVRYFFDAEDPSLYADTLLPRPIADRLGMTIEGAFFVDRLRHDIYKAIAYRWGDKWEERNLQCARVFPGGRFICDVTLLNDHGLDWAVIAEVLKQGRDDPDIFVEAVEARDKQGIFAE